MIIQNYRRNQAQLGARSLSLERITDQQQKSPVQSHHYHQQQGKYKMSNKLCASLSTLNEDDDHWSPTNSPTRYYGVIMEFLNFCVQSNSGISNNRLQAMTA